MLLTKFQSEIARDTHRFRVVNCGRRAGKTTLAVEEIKGRSLQDRMSRINSLNISDEDKKKAAHVSSRDEFKCRVNYFAETYDDVRELVWHPLLQELKPAIVDKNEQRLEIIVRNINGDKSLIKLRSWENVEKMRGKKSDFNIYDEVAKYKNFWLMKQEVLRPTLSDYHGEELYISTPKGFNHFYDLYNMEKSNKDYKSFHFTSYNNYHLSKAEIDSAKEEMTEDRFAQEYMADFRKTEGLVYKVFNRDYHTFTEETLNGGQLPTFVDSFLAIDFGFRSPACILKIGKDRDRSYWVLEEYYKKGKTTPELIEQSKNMEHNYIYPDPEDAEKIEEFKRAGLYMREVNKRKGSVKNGINVVTELFKQNRIKIHRSCENLIWELETYSYPEKKPDRNENEDPVKENDHAVDALRYALMTNEPLSATSQHFGDNNKLRFT